MSRKSGLDYFPFDVDFFSDMKVRRIKKDCGPAAVSVLICLLCNIYRDDGYYIRLNEDLPFVIAETTGVTEGAVTEIINKAARVGFFNKALLDEYGILTSKGIQKRYIHVVRSSKLIREKIETNFDLLKNPEESGKPSEEKLESTEEAHESGEGFSQKNSIAKQTKVKDSYRGATAPVQRHKHGEYGWILLTDDQYSRLVADHGKQIVDHYIALVDERAQMNGNKYKWKDWNLTVRKAIREKWGGGPSVKTNIKNYDDDEDFLGGM